MSLSMCPVEIVEIFFRYSHGSDIINFRSVCKTWNNIIARLSQDTDLWEIKCKSEIPTHFCRRISEKLYPNFAWLDLNNQKNREKWLAIYESWVNWQRIKDSNFKTVKFEPFFIKLPMVKVTCVAVSENLIAVGSSEGFIGFYDVDNSTTEPIFVVDQMEYVANVQFFRDDKTIAAISSSDMCRITSWDVQSKKSIGKKQYGRLISVTPGTVWVTSNNELSVQNKKSKEFYEFPQLYGTIVALVAHDDEAFLWTNLGYSYKVNLNNPSDQYIEEYIEPPGEKVCKYYLFGPSIAVCITKDGFLGISVDCRPWMMYEILSKLHGVPTCVLFYAHVLVLGLDSGSVHIYQVNNVEDLNSWDFQSRNSRAIVVDNQAIVALDIMDRPNKQFLIAATSEKVNIIEIACSV